MLHVFLSPLGLGLILLGIHAALRRLRETRAARLTWPPLVLCVVLMTPAGANLLVRGLEGPQPNQAPPCASDASQALVLLTGGLDRPARDDQDFAALSPASLRRLFELYDRHLMTPERRLVIAGGGNTGGAHESQLVARMAQRLGLREEQMILDIQSNSTWDNAVETRRLLGAQASGITLVTSAMHMPRSVLAFERQGFKVCAVPVDSVYVPPGGLGYALPQTSSLRKSEAALHEWLGWLSYRLR